MSSRSCWTHCEWYASKDSIHQLNSIRPYCTWRATCFLGISRIAISSGSRSQLLWELVHPIIFGVSAPLGPSQVLHVDWGKLAFLGVGWGADGSSQHIRAEDVGGFWPSFVWVFPKLIFVIILFGRSCTLVILPQSIVPSPILSPFLQWTLSPVKGHRSLWEKIGERLTVTLLYCCMVFPQENLTFP